MNIYGPNGKFDQQQTQQYIDWSEAHKPDFSHIFINGTSTKPKVKKAVKNEDGSYTINID